MGRVKMEETLLERIGDKSLKWTFIKTKKETRISI